MGCETSVHLTEAPEDFNYFCATFHWTDTLRLIHASPRSIALIKKTIISNWEKGIKSVCPGDGVFDFEIKGHPFKDRALACYILQFLLADSWVLKISSDMSRMIDFSSWFFEHDPSKKASGKHAHICCIAMAGDDQLHIVKANEEVLVAVTEALDSKYSKGYKGEVEMGDGDWMIRLKGTPWISEDEDGMEARQFILELLSNMQALNYNFYGKANTNGTADALFFVNHPDGDSWFRPGHFSMLSLNGTDKLRVVNYNKAHVKTIRGAITKYRGSDGVQKEGESYGTYEFKLRGNPWAAEAQDVVIARLFITKALEELYSVGWKLVNTIDMSRRMNDKAVLILKSTQPANVPHFCLAPCDMDKLMVIGAPDSVINRIRAMLEKAYPRGIQGEDDDFYGCFQFKLKGMPWFGRQGYDESYARSFLCFLISDLAEEGWQPLGSCDISAKHVRGENGPDYPLDVHSWFFAKLS